MQVFNVFYNTPKARRVWRMFLQRKRVCIYTYMCVCVYIYIYTFFFVLKIFFLDFLISLMVHFQTFS